MKFARLNKIGFPRHRIGGDGSVWRYSKSRKRWRKLSTYIKRSKNYSTPAITICYKGTKKEFSIGHLVLTGFVGPCPPGMECCHSPDPNTFNNSIENLRWGTRISNIRESFRVRGITKKIIKRKTRKQEALFRVKSGTCNLMTLTSEKVLKIRKLHDKGWSMPRLAKKFKTHRTNIFCIVRRKTWTHLK